jgi:hypothetical protein
MRLSKQTCAQRIREIDTEKAYKNITTNVQPFGIRGQILSDQCVTNGVNTREIEGSRREWDFTY